MTLYDKLESALRTARERGPVYGHDGAEVTGRAMAKLFPEGVALRTDTDFARFLILNHIVGKISRYTKNFAKGGHQDSIHDIGVYSFILEDLDDRCNAKTTQQEPANNIRPVRDTGPEVYGVADYPEICC
jgi:hypothetical protein